MKFKYREAKHCILGIHTYVLTIKEEQRNNKVHSWGKWWPEGLGNGMRLLGDRSLGYLWGFHVFPWAGRWLHSCVLYWRQHIFCYAFVSTWYLIKTIFNNCLQKIYEDPFWVWNPRWTTVSAVLPIGHDRPPCEPYLGGVEVPWWSTHSVRCCHTEWGNWEVMMPGASEGGHHMRAARGEWKTSIVV